MLNKRRLGEAKDGGSCRRDRISGCHGGSTKVIRYESAGQQLKVEEIEEVEM
jgi:hypothetical protein